MRLAMKSKYEISWKLINLFHSKNQGIVQRDKRIPLEKVLILNSMR